MTNLKDLKIGDTVYCLLLGYKAYNKSEDEIIETWIVTGIGRKYITAKKKTDNTRLEYTATQFDKTRNYTEKTYYSYERKLYASKQEIFDERETNTLLSHIIKELQKTKISESLTLIQIRQIHSILLES